MTLAQIIQKIFENGRVETGNNASLETEFEFEAGEQGWNDSDIEEAKKSKWFPWFK